jgi:head-tail adaptor
MILTDDEKQAIWNDVERLASKAKLMNYLKNLADRSIKRWQRKKENENNAAAIEYIDRYINISLKNYYEAETQRLELDKRLDYLFED